MRTALRGIGETLITVGLVILLFCVYELWFTGFYTAREQSRLHKELDRIWALPGVEFPEVPVGHGLAVLRIPRLGRGYHPVIVEGVGVEELKKGPGHYPGTALPGRVGNFVVSGHRTTYGHPFNKLDKVKTGDAIVIETRTTWYTYREIKEQVVQPDAIWVIDPIPRDPEDPLATPTPSASPKSGRGPRLLTFTTCNPKYSASQRLVLFAELESTLAKKDGTPQALAERP